MVGTRVQWPVEHTTSILKKQEKKLRTQLRDTSVLFEMLKVVKLRETQPPFVDNPSSRAAAVVLASSAEHFCLCRSLQPQTIWLTLMQIFYYVRSKLGLILGGWKVTGCGRRWNLTKVRVPVQSVWRQQCQRFCVSRWRNLRLLDRQVHRRPGQTGCNARQRYIYLHLAHHCNAPWNDS